MNETLTPHIHVQSSTTSTTLSNTPTTLIHQVKPTLILIPQQLQPLTSSTRIPNPTHSLNQLNNLNTRHLNPQHQQLSTTSIQPSNPRKTRLNRITDLRSHSQRQRLIHVPPKKTPYNRSSNESSDLHVKTPNHISRSEASAQVPRHQGWEVGAHVRAAKPHGVEVADRVMCALRHEAGGPCRGWGYCGVIGGVGRHQAGCCCFMS